MPDPKLSVVPASRLTPQQLDSFRRAAKVAARGRGIAHSAALDEIAAQHGYRNWSLLARAVSRTVTASGRAASPASLEEMVDWFRSHHTLAVEESPWDGREGGYLYPTLDGASDIAEILADQFPNSRQADVEEAAGRLDDGEPWLEPRFTRLLDEEAKDAVAAYGDAPVKEFDAQWLEQQPPQPADPDLADKL